MSTALPRFGSLCLCIALLATACKKDSASKVPESFEACATELASVPEFAKTGLEGIAPDQVKSVVGARLDRIGVACQPLFVEKACSEAVANMKQALSGGPGWLDVCREAFCADASDQAACQPAADSATLLEGIWSKHWGAKAAATMRKRVESLSLDPNEINVLLMTQIEKMFAGPIKVDMDAIRRLAPPARPATTQTIRVKVSESGMVIEGDDMEAIVVAGKEALAGELQKLSSAGVTPQSTAVAIMGSETTSYQEVIDIMDQLAKAGFDQISIGSSIDQSEDEPKTTPAEDLKSSAVVTISETSVSVDGKTVGELSDGAEAWQAAMVAALKTGHAGSSTIIIQADKAALYATIVGAIDSARSAGFNEVLFAVNRK